MKRIILLAFVLCSLFSYAQPPVLTGPPSGSTIPYSSNWQVDNYPISMGDNDPCDGYYIQVDNWQDASLYFELGLNEVDLSENQSSTVNFTVNYYNKLSSTNKTLLHSENVELSIGFHNSVAGTTLYFRELPLGPNGVNYIEFKINEWAAEEIEDDNLGALQLKGILDKVPKYKYIFIPCIYTNAVANGQTPVTANPVTFTWENCCQAPNYEFQLLRLFNRDDNPNNPIATEFDGMVDVDWSRALDLETGNSQKSLTLTVAEGTGWYVWRVRPIFDVKPNTVGDDRNWGVWTPYGVYETGAILYPKDNLGSYVFYYSQFDEDKNWIYSRSFVEGEPDHGSQLRIGEGINYANGLLMPRQSQIKNQTENEVLGSQTVLDYDARPSLQSLAAPLGKNYFSYEYSLLRSAPSNLLYKTSDMDGDTKYKHPSEVGTLSKINSYYSNSNPDLSIPNAENIPFSQSIFYNDGLGRLKAQAGAGKTFDLHNGARYNRFYYSKATDAELIKVFGDEAPAGASVDKTMSVDGNGTVSVTYKDENERVIATCLSKPGSPYLEPLEFETYNSQSVIHNVDDIILPPTGYEDGGKTLVSTATYSFAEPTILALDYVLNKKRFGGGCLNLCATCDYEIDIIATNAEDPNFIAKKTVVFNMSALATCPTSMDDGQYVWSGALSSASGLSIVEPASSAVALDPGMYTVTRKLRLHNKNSNGQEYFDQALESALLSMSNILYDGNFKVLGIAGANQNADMTDVRAYLDNNDINGLYTYLGVAQTTATTMTWSFLDGCVNFDLDIIHCPQPNCTAPNYFTNEFITQINNNLAPNVANYVTPSGANSMLLESYSQPKIITPSTPIHGWYPSSGVTFDDMVQTYMLNNGYTCEEVNYSWQNLIQKYKDLVDYSTANNLAWPDLLHEFILGTFSRYKIEGFRNPQSGNTQHIDVIREPYKYFTYTYGDCQQCQNAFYCNPATQPSSAITSAAAFQTWFDALSVTDKTNFYYCVYNSCNSTASVTSVNNSVNQIFGANFPAQFQNNQATTPTDPLAMETYMEEMCTEHCEDSWQGYVDQIIAEYEAQGIAVAGYTCVSCSPGTPVPLSEVYCKANAMVAKCKEGCQLSWVTISNAPAGCSSQYLGTTSEIEAYKNSMTGMVDLNLPNPINSTSCATGYSYAAAPSTTGTTSSIPALITQLNDKAEQVLSNIENQVFASPYVWNVNSIFNLFPQGAGSSTCSSTMDITLANSTCAIEFTAGKKIAITNTPFTVGGVSAIAIHEYLDEMSIYMTQKIRTKVTIATLLPGQSVSITDVLSNCTLVSGSNIFNAQNTGTQTLNGATFIFDYIIKPTTTATTIHIGDISYVPSWTGLTYLQTISNSDDISVHNCCQIYYELHCNPNTPEPIDYIGPLCTFCDVELSCGGICYKYTTPPDIQTFNIQAYSCEMNASDVLFNQITNGIQQALNDQAKAIRVSYKTNCMGLNDQLQAKWDLNYYYYTLYYYDRASNLVRTVPPKGVHYLLSPDDDRMHHPAHSLITEYEYNSIKQLIRQKTPDGGETFFWYDKKGRLRFSRNEQQLDDGTFSYTKYDDLSRIIEVGKSTGLAPLTNAVAFNAQLEDKNFPTNNNTANPPVVCTDITSTVYDTPIPTNFYPNTDVPEQRFLENRISYTYTNPDGILASGTTNLDENYTIYSYDPHGNVEWLEQRLAAGVNNELVSKRMYYQYDLASGAVLKVKYNPSYNTIVPAAVVPTDDEFQHRYVYDADKRLISVYTSLGYYQPSWNKEVQYQYYKHGPLKRTVLGNTRLQGLDYTYTLQGWLKAINHSSLLASKDPGHDDGFGAAAKDVWGMELQYFPNDYDREYGSTQSSFNANTSNPYFIGTDPLYNGNISAWTSNIDLSNIPPNSLSGLYFSQLTGNKYKYDELNRIMKSDFTWYDVINGWDANTTNQYSERFRYDLNGNIKHLLRNGFTGTNGNNTFMSSPNFSISSNMDDFTYNYTVNTNKLVNVQDGYTSTTAQIQNDIKPGQAPVNYRYDKIGNLVADQQEFLGNNTSLNGVEWNVYGKVSAIKKTTGLTERFMYDASGNRVSKLKDITLSSVLQPQGELYVRDASGNIMATYDLKRMTGSSIIDVTERPLYGSDRLGVFKNTNINFVNVQYGNEKGREYELKDHLGNVRAVISDNKIEIGSNLIASGMTGATAESNANLSTSGSTYLLSSNNTTATSNAINYPITTVAGINYQFGFSVSDQLGNASNVVSATWEVVIVDVPSNSILSFNNINITSQATPYTFSFVAISTQSKVIFRRASGLNVPIAITNVTVYKKQYTPEIIHSSNLFAFGSLHPGRNYDKFTAGYRFGFNGQEKDNEVKGDGNSLDFGARIYDSRLGRFLSVDPDSKITPSLSAYQFANNSPICTIDKNGKIGEYYLLELLEKTLFGTSHLKKIREGFVERGVETAMSLPEAIMNIREAAQQNINPRPFGLVCPTGDCFQSISPLDIDIAVIKGIIEDYGELLARVAEGDDKAKGALLFEIALLAIDIGEEKAILKGFSSECKNLVRSIGRYEHAQREIAILTYSEKFKDAVKIGKEIVGNVPANAKKINAKQGILKDLFVGYEWRDADGVFHQIRLDHDPKIGTHINVRVGKQGYSIPITLSEEQAKSLGINEIMSQLKK